MFTNMLFCCVYCISYSHTKFQVWPGAVYCCFNNINNILNMTLHAGLANPTCLLSFTVWYCSVYESNSKKEKEKKMKNFGAYGI